MKDVLEHSECDVRNRWMLQAVTVTRTHSIDFISKHIQLCPNLGLIPAFCLLFNLIVC